MANEPNFIELFDLLSFDNDLLDLNNDFILDLNERFNPIEEFERLREESVLVLGEVNVDPVFVLVADRAKVDLVFVGFKARLAVS